MTDVDLKPVFRSTDLSVYEAPSDIWTLIRRVQVAIDSKTVGATNLCAGTFCVTTHTPPDIHDMEEVYYILRGKGYTLLDGKKYDIEPDTWVYIGPKVKHQTFNTGKEDLWFIWIFPNQLKVYMQEVQGWKKKKLPGPLIK